MDTPWYNKQLHTSMDPLTTNFFTGGQMSYFPNSQYMTDSMYGAFRTPVEYRQNPVDHHYPTFMQSYLTTLRGVGSNPLMHGIGVTLAPSPIGTNQMEYQAKARRRIDDSVQATTDSILDFAIKSVSAAVGGAVLGGVAGGPVGSALGLVGGALGWELAPAVGGMRTGHTRLTRQIQNLTESLITNGPDVNKATGKGFSLPAANNFAKFLHHESANDAFLKLQDYEAITGYAAKTGMFNYSNSVDQYKDVIKSVRKDLLLLMDIYESANIGDVFKHMQRLQASGVAREKMVGIASTEQMFSTMLGISHQEMANTYGASGAVMFNQYGLTGAQGSLRNVANTASAHLAKKFGILTTDEENRLGGIGGAGERMTKAINIDAFGELEDLVLPILWDGSKEGKIKQDVFAKVMSREMSLQQIITERNKMFRDPTNISRYLSYKDRIAHTTREQMTEEGERKFAFDRGLEFADTYMRGAYKPGITLEDRAMMGLKALKVPDMDARRLVEEHTSPDIRKAKIEELERQEARIRTDLLKKKEEEVGWWSKLNVEFKRTYEQFRNIAFDVTGYDLDQKRKQRQEETDVGAAGGAAGGAKPGFFTGAKPEEQNKYKSDVYSGSGSGSPVIGGGKNRPLSSLNPGEYDQYILDAASKYGENPNFLKAVMRQESGFNPNNISTADAYGLMQFIPTTAKDQGIFFDYDKYKGHSVDPYLLGALKGSVPEDANISISDVASQFNQILKENGGDVGKAKQIFAERNNTTVSSIDDLTLHNKSKHYDLFEKEASKKDLWHNRDTIAKLATATPGSSTDDIIAELAKYLTEPGANFNEALNTYLKAHGITKEALNKISTKDAVKTHGNSVLNKTKKYALHAHYNATMALYSATKSLHNIDPEEAITKITDDFYKLLVAEGGDEKKALERYSKEFDVPLEDINKAYQRNIRDNVMGGAKYFNHIRRTKHTKSDEEALAGYNAGPERIHKALREFKETKNYVNKIMGYYAEYEKNTPEPGKQGITEQDLPSVATRRELYKSTMGSKEFLEMDSIAKDAGIDFETLMALYNASKDMHGMYKPMALQIIATRYRQELTNSEGDQKAAVESYSLKYKVPVEDILAKAEEELGKIMKPGVINNFKEEPDLPWVIKPAYDAILNVFKSDSRLTAEKELRASGRVDKLRSLTEHINAPKDKLKAGEQSVMDATDNKLQLNILSDYLQDTDKVESLYDEGLEKHLAKSIYETAKRQKTFKSNREAEEYANKAAQQILNSKDAKTYVIRSILKNKELANKLSNTIGEDVNALMAGEVNSSWVNAEQRTKSIKAIAPQALPSIGVGADSSLEGLLGKSIMYSSAYRAVTLNNTLLNDKSRKELLEELNSNFPGIEVNAQGTFDEEDMKKKLLEMNPNLSPDDIDHLFGLAKKKGSQLTTPSLVEDFSKMSKPIRARESRSMFQGAELGYKRSLFEEGLSDATIEDPAKFAEYMSKHPESSVGKSISAYKKSHGDKWDRAQFISENESYFSKQADKTQMPSINDPKYLEEMNKAVEPLRKQMEFLKDLPGNIAKNTNVLDNLDKATTNLNNTLKERSKNMPDTKGNVTPE